MSNDEQAIRKIISTWMQLTAEGDLDRILPLMDEDAVFLTCGHPPMRGREAFAAASRANSGQMDIEGNAEPVEVAVSGELAYAWTNLSLNIRPRNGGAPMQRTGPTLTVFRKTPAGTWVLFRDANLLVSA